ncbi:ABC transporter ATP-binding protein [Halobaculum sp. MBLA0147]|uniref:ABC transporter ATP-binding protein n=1 Tax=Halobaculum sp. MBLA0147 TaxID=3079934 RepID=UPI003524712E
MVEAVRLERITKRFPGVVANDEVTLSVERGSVHALLGENGAGKTTLMNVLYGLYRPTEGSVYVDPDGLETDATGDVRAPPSTFDSPRDAIEAGVGMIHQHFMLVDTMTVAENVTLGDEPTKWGGLAVDREAGREAVRDLSDRYGFDVDPDAQIADVSVGVQQRVEILKALYRGADVLILDEPTAVLTPQEVEDLFRVFEELTAAGKTILFITHKLGEAMDAADDVTVLRDGEKVGTVDANTTTREELAEMMVGRGVVLETETPAVRPGETVLDVSELVVTDDRGVRAVDGVNLAVREGEILGIAGVDGNGQSELIEAVTGLTRPEAGEIRLDDESLRGVSRRERARRGMAYVPEDRQERGLVMPFDLTANGLLGSQHDEPFSRGGRIDWTTTREHAAAIVEEYDVRPPDPDASAESLSGGNQQKFVVGREVARDPSCLVASHPTRGVDIGSTEFIHDRLIDLRGGGTAILLVSSKLDEVRELSDRLAVMHQGSVVDVVDPDAVSEEQLGLLMAGEDAETVPRVERVAATTPADGTAGDASGEAPGASADATDAGTAPTDATDTSGSATGDPDTSPVTAGGDEEVRDGE